MSMFATEAAAADKFVNRPDDPAGPASLPVDAIEPAANQPRGAIEGAKIESLAESIRQDGVLNPILVEPAGPGRWRIIAGERRWRAAKLAGLEAIPATVREGLSREDVAALQLVENLQREDLTPIEEARALGALIQRHGFTQEALGERLGKSRARIAQGVALLKLPDDLQRQCHTCDIPWRVLYEVATAEGNLQRSLFERAKRDNLTVAQARREKKAAADAGNELPGPRRINAQKIALAGVGTVAVNWPPELREADNETKAAALEKAAAALREQPETA